MEYWNGGVPRLPEIGFVCTTRRVPLSLAQPGIGFVSRLVSARDPALPGPGRIGFILHD